MANFDGDETFYSLEPLGFEGWESTAVVTDERGNKSCIVRRVGHLLGHNVYGPRGSMFSAVSFLIDGLHRAAA